jgi:GNAT superfamily N-acetyltransferase
MEVSPNDPDFSSAIEAVEARGWTSLSGVTRTEPLFDDRGTLVATALFSEPRYPLLNRVVGLGLDRAVREETLDRILEMYDAARAETICIPTPPTARPSRLPRLLMERGFEPGLKEAKLYRTTLDPPDSDRHDRIVEATTGDSEVVRQMYGDAGMDADWADIMTAKLGADHWHHYIALDEGKPVALASMFASQELAWCPPGWTPPAYRRRGHQRALATHRIAAAAKLGCKWVNTNVDVTDSPLGFTVRSYTRLGFELLYVRTTYIRHRPDVPLPNAYARRLLISNNQN